MGQMKAMSSLLVHKNKKLKLPALYKLPRVDEH